MTGHTTPAVPAAGVAAGSPARQHTDTSIRASRTIAITTDRGYAVHTPPAHGVANLIGQYGERYYFQAGNWFRWRGDWYRDWGGAWVVVDAPVGLLVPSLPPYCTTIWWNGTPYSYANDTYYVWNAQWNEYQVVGPPEGLKAAGAS